MMEELERLRAEEAARMEEQQDADLEYVRPSPPRNPSQVYTVRVPVDKLESLRRLAQDRGIPPSAMIRQWVLERLAHESTPDVEAPSLHVGTQWRRDITRLRAGTMRTARSA
jgi:hypothetical protein